MPTADDGPSELLASPAELPQPAAPRAGATRPARLLALSYSKIKAMGRLRLAGAALLIIVIVNLHAIGALWLARTSLGSWLPHSPIGYVMVGVLLILIMVGLKHWLGFSHHKPD